MSGYLLAEDVAQLLGCSVRTVHERARLGQVPHRRIGKTRRLLFVEEEILAWVDGCELERVDAPLGGRVVRPVRPSNSHITPTGRNPHER